MRRAATGILVGLLIATAVGALSSVALTRRALAAAMKAPPVLCLDAGTVAQMRTGASPLADKDLIVAETANFAMGARPAPTLWWHVREAIIHEAYRTFWSEASRAAVFDQIASRMRSCPPRSGP